MGMVCDKNVFVDKLAVGQVRTLGDSLDWECICVCVYGTVSVRTCRRGNSSLIWELKLGFNETFHSVPSC